MPVNYYPNATKDELILMLESLQRRSTVGQVYMITTSGDQQMRSFQGAASVDVVHRRILYSLFLVDPDNYDNPFLQRVRRVSPSY